MNDTPISRAFALECLLVALQRARALAIVCNLDASFVSEIDHLSATAEHNREED